MNEVSIELVDFAEYLADEARKISRKYFRTNLGVETKADKSPVTEADREIEMTIRKLVENNFPQHSIYGEEYGQNYGTSEYTWVIDPIDGTKSFMTGRAIFGTLISLVKNDAPVLGIIDQPIVSERWLGVNGKTTFNGEVISARSPVRINDAVFATTSPFLFDERGKSIISKVTEEVSVAIYGGDCYSYGQLALGLLDIIIESGLKPYDYCALVPVIENAGGVITDWEGEKITMGSNGDVIACGDPALHTKLLREIF